jgi:hypothetical protein
VKVWVVRVCGAILGLICAAGVLVVRSGSSENEHTGKRIGWNQTAKGLSVSDEGQKRGFEARGNTPLRDKAERGGAEVLQPSSSTGGCFADEAHQGVLIGHEVTLQDGHVASVLPVHRHALESQVFE